MLNHIHHQMGIPKTDSLSSECALDALGKLKMSLDEQQLAALRKVINGDLDELLRALRTADNAERLANL